MEFRGSKNMAVETEEQRAIGNMNRGHTRTWLENERLARGVNDDGFVAGSLQLEFLRMEETEDPDADIPGDYTGIKH